MKKNVVVVGATGASGRRIARQLAGHGVPLTLAGRRPAALAGLAAELGAGTIEADLSRAADIAAGARLVVNTVGPFTSLAGELIEACLAAQVPYVDIANEFGAVRHLLGLHDRAIAQRTVLVTGAGFGPAVTEALVLGLMKGRTAPPAAVRVAAAPSAGDLSPGVSATVAQAVADGAIRYADGLLITEPLGSGATQILFDGRPCQVIPAPVGDMEAARRASGAADVTAYFAAPGQHLGQDAVSYAYADVKASDGAMAASLAIVGDGMAATAAIAAATVRRLLDDDPARAAGAWTPGARYGQDLVTSCCDITIRPADPAAAWGGTASGAR
jgi:short subunit dehydrogenase-like uncharacterized protein